MAPVGRVPERLGGAYYGTGLVIFLTIVTLGIWGALWTYRTSEDLKRYNGDGLGGVLGVVIYLLLSIVLMFTIPNEIDKMYQRDGRQSPVSAVWGLWFLLPLIGTSSGTSRCSGAQRLLAEQGRRRADPCAVPLRGDDGASRSSEVTDERRSDLVGQGQHRRGGRP
jgi:hypothetical protein